MFINEYKSNIEFIGGVAPDASTVYRRVFREGKKVPMAQSCSVHAVALDENANCSLCRSTEKHLADAKRSIGIFDRKINMPLPIVMLTVGAMIVFGILYVAERLK